MDYLEQEEIDPHIPNPEKGVSDLVDGHGTNPGADTVPEYSGNGTNDRSNPASLWAKRSTALYSEGYAIFKAWCTTQRIEGTQNKTGKYHHNYSLVEIQLACRRQHRLPQNKTLNNDNR